MKNLVCLIILSFTLVFTVFGQTPKTEKEWFTLGFKQREEYKFNESVISFTECLKINPNSSPCLGLRAKSYWNLSKLDLAEKDFNRSIEVSPNTPALYLNRGEFRQSFLDNQKNELALADFTKAIQLKPDFAEAYYFRGQSFVFKKDYNAAEADYKKALEINPNYTSARKALEKLKAERPGASPTPSPSYRPSNPTPVYQPKSVPSPTPTLSEAEKAKLAENFLSSAVYNFRGDKFDAAAQDFTEYLKLYPNNANVYFNRGTAYQRAGKNDLAKADFEKALQLNPNLSEAKAQLEKLKTTPKEERVTSISQIKDVKPTDEFYDDLRSLVERYGISPLTVNYQYNPNQNLTLLEYTKFIAQAKKILLNATSGFGVKKIDEEKLFNSKCSFANSFVNSISETEVAKSLGCIFRLEKLALNPTSKILTRGKFAIFLNQAFEQAALKIAIDKESENVTDNLFTGEPKQTAKTDLPKTNSQTDWTKFLKAGTEKLKVKDYDGAIKSYTECLKVTQAIMCYKNRGITYGFKKQYQLALADFDQVIKINPKSAETFSTRGLLRMETGDIFGALSDVEKAVELEPENPQMYLNRASIFCRIKEYRVFVKQDEDKARELGGKVVNPCQL